MSESKAEAEKAKRNQWNGKWKKFWSRFKWNRIYLHVLLATPILGFWMIERVATGHWFVGNIGWQEIMKSLGVALVTGGVISGTIQALRFFDFFKRQLEEILSGEGFLKKRGDLRDVWSKVSRALWTRKFPDSISQGLENIICDYYFPQNFPYYTVKFDSRIDMELVNKTHIKTTEVTIHHIRTHTNEMIKGQFTSQVNRSGAGDGSIICLQSFKVNGVELVTEPTITDKKFKCAEPFHLDYYVEKNNNEITASGKFRYKGCTEYRIERRFETTFPLKFNPVQIWRASHIFQDITVEINHPPQLVLMFQGVGTIEEFDVLPVTNTKTCLRRLYKSVLLPYQGYVVTFIKQ